MADVAIMYSGGLDSLIAYHFAKSKGLDPICINVGLGQPYDAKEQNSIKSLGNWSPEVHRIDLSDLYGLIQKRLTNQIIPSRNVLLATIGGMFAPRVWINALDGEQNGKEHDKSERFFEDTTSLLSFTNEFFQKETIVESPFAHMTKGETIRWALAYGIPKEILFATSSCYDGDEVKCSVCLTCVKRYLAFLETGVVEPGYHTDPLTSDYFKELWDGIPEAAKNGDYSRFTRKRVNGFLALVNSDFFKQLVKERGLTFN